MHRTRGAPKVFCRDGPSLPPFHPRSQICCRCLGGLISRDHSDMLVHPRAIPFITTLSRVQVPVKSPPNARLSPSHQHRLFLRSLSLQPKRYKVLELWSFRSFEPCSVVALKLALAPHQGCYSLVPPPLFVLAALFDQRKSNSEDNILIPAQP